MSIWVNANGKSGFVTRKEDLRDYMEDDLYEAVETLIEGTKATKEIIKELEEDKIYWERVADENYGRLVDTINELDEIINIIEDSSRLDKNKLKARLKALHKDLYQNV